MDALADTVVVWRPGGDDEAFPSRGRPLAVPGREDVGEDEALALDGLAHLDVASS